jgi:hypothetical protein
LPPEPGCLTSVRGGLLDCRRALAVFGKCALG